MKIEFANTGKAGAVFQVRSAQASDAPRTYTVEPRKELTGCGRPPVPPTTCRSTGPGFFRSFKGGTGANRARLDVRANVIAAVSTVTLSITNSTGRATPVRVLDKYTGKDVNTRLAAGRSFLWFWSALKVWGWYDLVITVADDPVFEYRLAGHIENGRDTASDPGMGGLVAKD